MMSARKKQDSTLREVFVTSLQLVLGGIAGVVLCGVWLVLKPVTIMDGPPAEARVATDRHEVTYVRGRIAMRGAQGPRKQKAFLERTPGELVFIEEDLNRWMASAYGADEKTYPIKGTGVTLAPRVPAARLVGDALTLGLEIAIEGEDIKHTMVVQARGAFADRGGRQVFVPGKVYLGSCPLPWNLGGKQVYEKFMELFPVAENVSAAWGAVSKATVAENRLRLVIGAPAPVAESVPVPVPVPAPVTVEPVVPATVSLPETLPAAAAEATPAEVESVPAPEATIPASVEPTADVPVDQAPALPTELTPPADTLPPVGTDPATTPDPATAVPESETTAPATEPATPATEPAPSAAETEAAATEPPPAAEPAPAADETAPPAPVPAP